MDAGALGIEVTIGGKLTTQRARTEKFRQGLILKTGDQVEKQVLAATAHSQMKQGLFGVKVAILPPDFDFLDRPSMREISPKPAAEAAEISEEEVEEKVEEEDAPRIEETVAEKVDEKVEVRSEEKEGEKTADSEKA
jgi:small subunit ribosomal protein S3